MNEDLTQAAKRPAKRVTLSPVWLIPLAAALIGAWLLYQNIKSLGPTITLELNNAEGLEAGKTRIKIRNVDVGTVEDLRLSKDFKNAIAIVQMQPEIENLLVEDSQFWVVKPRVGRQGVSGLGTIISGTYIQMRPGESDKSARRFQVLDRPPPTRPDVPGISIHLESDGTDTLSIGDPIIFQGQTVGQIETVEFEVDQKHLSYTVFIESPYDRLVTENTEFWPRSGIDVQVSSDGVDVQVESLQALFTGGLTFGVPEGISPGPPVENGATFQLYPSYKAVLDGRFDENIKYVILFDDSVRDLHKGASVEFRGIRVGTVAEVPFLNRDVRMDQLESFRIPVLIKFEPQRLHGAWQEASLDEWQQRLSVQFENGLRATLKTANLLTGAKFVDLVFNEEAEMDEQKTVGTYPVFPSQPGGFTTLEQKVTQLLDKLNKLPLESLIASLEDTLNNASTTLKGANTTLEGAKATFNEAEKTIQSLNSILNDDALKQAPEDLQNTLRELRNTLVAYQQGEPVYENANQTLQELKRLLEDISTLTDTLRAKPNAIIFGIDQGEDPVPTVAP